MPIAVLSCLLAFAVSLGGVLLIRSRAEEFGLVAAVNHRSSHDAPTPSGGGVGIALGAIAGWLVLWTIGFIAAPALILSAGMLAILGFVDDRSALSARLRLGVQAVAVSLLLAVVLPMMPSDAYWGIPLIVFAPFALLTLIWWVNLFNFMDGIDGLAASQALFMIGGALILAIAQGINLSADPLLWGFGVLAVASLGFLLFNWPPASIFMGDAGSLFLALGLAGLALFSISAGWLTPLQWLVLAALFAIDASVTLLRRVLSGHSPASAHRTHLYQRLARRWGGARPVILAASSVNVLIVLPVAHAAANPDLTGFLPVGFLSVAGIGAAWWGGAGLDENA